MQLASWVSILPNCQVHPLQSYIFFGRICPPDGTNSASKMALHEKYQLRGHCHELLVLLATNSICFSHFMALPPLRSGAWTGTEERKGVAESYPSLCGNRDAKAAMPCATPSQFALANPLIFRYGVHVVAKDVFVVKKNMIRFRGWRKFCGWGWSTWPVDISLRAQRAFCAATCLIVLAEQLDESFFSDNFLRFQCAQKHGSHMRLNQVTVKANLSQA